jgi:hypothetical protein
LLRHARKGWRCARDEAGDKDDLLDDPLPGVDASGLAGFDRADDLRLLIGLAAGRQPIRA